MFLDTCRLCGCTNKLCESHIVPEFLYKPLYDDKHKMLGINGLGNRGAKPLQKGIREYLFCNTCECFFNDEIEKPFLSEWEKIIETNVPKTYKPWDAISIKTDYKTIKLFTLSVLFRCSVSKLSTFSGVNLGHHQDNIKEMLLNCEPGDENKYPLIANLVINKGYKPEVRYISIPVEYREDCHRVYGQIYGGFMWWHKVSSHDFKKYN